MTLPPQIELARVADGIEIAYETFGDRANPPVLLVMGLATQMLGWPDGFCEQLAGRGHYVVRFDNRDIGLSTHLHDAPKADIHAVAAGDTRTAAYRLADMARDAVGLLDVLGLDSVHLVGASMGGMIAQTIAIEYPERVLSLTSIMSTTGDRAVGAPSEAAVGVLLAPPARTREEAMEQAVAGARVVGSPGFDRDEDDIRERAGRSFDRAHDPAGVGRQFAAILASPDRTERLGEIRAPTVVIHGTGDALINVDGGQATAAAIPGAELVLVDGMGHDLPRGVWPRILDQISALVERASAQ